jgi:hypothetical protein
MDLRKIAFKCPNANKRFPRLLEAIWNNMDVEKTMPTSFPGQRDGNSMLSLCAFTLRAFTLQFHSSLNAICALKFHLEPSIVACRWSEHWVRACSCSLQSELAVWACSWCWERGMYHSKINNKLKFYSLNSTVCYMQACQKGSRQQVHGSLVAGPAASPPAEV